ncbi:MAG TPA: PIG-L family deacetylase [Thermoanaerobaculia bacterium]|nr:PIG-L family deacetylase [Thermoanaerobaculia bacterium]
MFVPGLITFLVLVLTPVHGEASVKSYPKVAKAASHERILIVAPHIDDEAIGAGGYATDAIAAGAEVYVVFITAGDCNRFSARILHRTLDPTALNYLSVGRTRIAEAKSAMKLLGVPDDRFFILGYPDRGLKTILDNRESVILSRGTQQRAVPYEDAMTPGATYSFGSLMADMERVMAQVQPTTVIAPVPFDLHPDHSAAAEITDLAIDDLGFQPQRLGYLIHVSRIPKSFVWMPRRALAPPPRMRTLTWATYPLTAAVQRKKDALLQTYKSQRPYVFLLRNAYVRSNELFFTYDAPSFVGAPMPGASMARLPIAR